MNETCLVCGEELPPINGDETNDFSFMCKACRIDMGRDEEE